MTVQEICDVIGPGNYFRIYDVTGEPLAEGLRFFIVRDRWYLMDKCVLAMNACIDSVYKDPYISMLLDVRKEELFK